MASRILSRRSMMGAGATISSRKRVEVLIGVWGGVSTSAAKRISTSARSKSHPVVGTRTSPLSQTRPFHGTEERDATVQLAFDLHEPTNPKMSKQEKPILFLHGLFGSKKNNRSLSRALARDTGRFVYALVCLSTVCFGTLLHKFWG